MEATTLNPVLASSIAVSNPIPLEEPVITAILVDMEFNIGSFCTTTAGVCPRRERPPEGVAMRTFMHARHRQGAYFHSHPMHTAYSLIASLALAGLMVLALVIAAR